ncbi:(3R)-3-hydroxyacyl-CoA dehydrogenase isoform X2 [Meriones unguiculatus]|uniref:(3R)-3-hydroxyacyl-CoA dehydrogenase isoform X2 n=1 Tax=Meriones unguiculatus TaxID=10047 RepID=UPI00293E19DE|nr:(3R)-3-hydroxyacyl-CoA dehydrogenase isoform X2 [Meriones unguiculatus]
MASQLRLCSALALVTGSGVPTRGAGSGIGRAISVRLAAEGAAVAACDLDEAAAQDTVRLLSGPGSEDGAPRGKHAAFQADVSQAPAAGRLLQQVQACFARPPSVVVSCAGITRDEFLLHMSEDDWDRVIAVNLKGTFLVTQAAAQALVSSGCRGSIINISSIIGKVGNIGQTNYASSKAGVIGLTQTAARELGRHGIRCNSVLPGFIATPMTRKMPEKVKDKMWQMWLRSWRPKTVATSQGPPWKSPPRGSWTRSPPTAAWPPADGDAEFPGYKRDGGVWLGHADYGRQGRL